RRRVGRGRAHAGRGGSEPPPPPAPPTPDEDARAGTEPDGVALVPLDTVPPASVRWAWDGRIPLGAVTLLVGDGGLGKSTLLLDVAARLSRGQLARALDRGPFPVPVPPPADPLAPVL